MNRIGFHQTKGRFMKQFSTPSIKMIVSNNDKVYCPSLPQPDGCDGRKGRINGSPLWQRRHLLLKKSSSWSSAAVKEPMLTQSMPLPKIRLNYAYLWVLLWQRWSSWKCMWRYLYTKNWGRGPWQWGSRKIRKSKFVEMWKGINVSTLWG